MNHLTVKPNQVLWNKTLKPIAYQCLVHLVDDNDTPPERKCDFVIL